MSDSKNGDEMSPTAVPKRPRLPSTSSEHNGEDLKSSAKNSKFEHNESNKSELELLPSDPKPSTSSESSCSSTSSNLARGMSNKVHIVDNVESSRPAEKRFKFEPNENFLDQLLAMGISFNGARKALFYTGNRSVALATNWIFDHPELDLETPLEEEMRRLAPEDDDSDDQEDEAAFEDEDDDDEGDDDSDLGIHIGDANHYFCHQFNRHHTHRHQYHQHHHCHGHLVNGKMPEGVYIGDVETDSESDEFDEDDIPDFKMVFVVNTSLNMGAGKTAAQVGHAALGVQRVLTAKSQTAFKVTLAELGLWQDFGEKMVVLKGESTQHLRDLQLMADDLELPSFLVKDAGITQVSSGDVTVFGVFGEEEDVNKITGRLKLL